jgi:hypothetical protein
VDLWGPVSLGLRRPPEAATAKEVPGIQVHNHSPWETNGAGCAASRAVCDWVLEASHVREESKRACSDHGH